MTSNSFLPSDPERQSRVEMIFYGALERSVLSERLRFVEEACEGDATLLSEVEELLQAHSAADSKFLEDGPLSPEGGFEFLRTERAGELVGHYKLLEPIGEGGFGTVWRAEQQKPVRRRVALKVLKLGMDTREVIARFEAERQALALMDHPSIAKVLDAGSTPAGRPYFVMELVEGVRITDYCDSEKLCSQERLKLFVQVCQAVQHAHQKGIIHRDIKPSNVLVSVQDGVPLPKVIDFGVAKAIQQKLTELTLQTRIEQLIGTPLYMSPEQAQFGGLDIDTRSDIYSLGVLLYELLTGRTPFDPGSLMQRGLDEIRRVIREEEPPRPSTALRTMAEETVNSVARQRQSEPPKLISLLRGDLDWIVMRALEKERSRRYETASSFAEDIRRHLANETVQARPPSASYRFRRLVQRNKGAFAAAAAITAALLIGITISLWQAIRANTALAALRASAPAFAEQARALCLSERFEEAIEKLDYAATLRPDLAEYTAAKGDILQSMLRLREAGDAYRIALKANPADARVQRSLHLCERLLARNADLQKLSRESLSELYAAMQREQRPTTLLLPVARRLGEEKRLLLTYWMERLNTLSIPPEKPLEKRLTMRADGLLALDLSHTTIADLTPLEGMPLGSLDCSACSSLTSIAALHAMPLRELSLVGSNIYDIAVLSTLPELKVLRLDDTKITSLSPLRGLPLQTLHLRRLDIHDLSPLRGMRLQELAINQIRATDLSHLTGMPLKRLEADSVVALDFTPLEDSPLESLSLRSTRPLSLDFLRRLPLKELFLSGCPLQTVAILSEIPTLEVLSLPDDYHSWPEAERAALLTLRRHPRLRLLGAEFEGGRRDALQPAEQFWQEWDTETGYLQSLRTSGIKIAMKVLPDRTWEILLDGEPVKDISSLKGAPISRLGLEKTKVFDLSPLAGMRLKALSIRRTNVADIQPLTGMPLEELDLGQTPITDLAPLRGMPLKRLGIEQTAISDLSPLAGMPLQEFWTGTTAIADLSPLKGMPIRTLQIDNCRRLKDLTPLLEIPTLEQILLPTTAENVDALRALPRLKYISFLIDGSVNRPSQTAEEFWVLKDPTTQDKLAEQGRYGELEQVLRMRIRNLNSIDEWMDYTKLAAVLLVQGKHDEYRKVCAQMFARLKDVRPGDVLKVCCLAPNSGIAAKEFQRLIDAEVLRKPNSAGYSWRSFAFALADYRMGRWSEASELLTNQLEYHTPAYSSVKAVLAMAEHHQNHSSVASFALGKAKQHIAGYWHVQPSQPDYWQDFLISRILIQEAEQLLGSSIREETK